MYHNHRRVTEEVDNIQCPLMAMELLLRFWQKKTELNVYLIGNVKKYIRINVKPNGSKGSGGGAAATAIQEAAQCVYAAMRILLWSKKRSKY